MTTNNNIGIFICTGCGIGESLDTEALCETAIKEGTMCCTHNALCSDEGTALINKEIPDNELTAVIIAACSPRIKTKEFSFQQDIITERVNLREQVVMCHPAVDEDTQMLAQDNIRMGIAKTKNIRIPQPYIGENLNSDILVVGGGITGITSAIEGAKAGYKITVIEKEPKPGGWACKLLKQLPQKIPYTELSDNMINEKISELENSNNITIHTSSLITKITGEPGMFDVTVDKNGEVINLRAGAIVMATGWKPYDASKLTEYNYGVNKNVITNIEFEELAKNNNISRPSDNKKADKILFIQCAGSRDEKHLPYCSTYCCATTLKHAKYARDMNKDSTVFIIYKDIRTPGMYEHFYQEIQKDDHIFFTKGEVTEITEKNGTSDVTVENTLIGETIKIEVDLVVLATGMTPANSDELNLGYRLGKGLPSLKYDFPDSHFICFPYETRRTGIYAAGALRAPMDIMSCKEDACGAMLKAIQCVESVKRGESVHPRSGDISFPELFMDRCTDCKRCTEECPFGSYDETEKGTPLPHPNRCRRCGICLGACPERIINFSDFNIESVSAMIKAFEVPDEFEEKPRILAFVCENDAYPAFDMAGYNRLEYSAYVRIIPVRCIGSVNKVWISDAFSQGFDGIMLIGCKPGDDYQCHYISGSELTDTRAENFQEALQTMMLEPERIHTEFIEINEYNRIPQIINDYVETIETIGPNPFKGM